MSGEWVEVEITVTNQSNRSATRHIEVQPSDATPEKAVNEIAGKIWQGIGIYRVRDANADR